MSGTPARKRINATEQRIVARSISGSLQQVVGSLAWGPHFGKVDPSTFVAEASGPVLEAVDFTGTLAPQATIDLDRVDLTGALEALGVIDLASIDLLGALGAQAAVDLDDVHLDGNLAADARIDLFSVNPTGNLLPQAAVDLDSLDLSGAVAGQAEQDFEIEVVNWRAAGDTFLDEDSGDTTGQASAERTFFPKMRAQSPLANDREHAYAWWDVGGTFDLVPTGFFGTVPNNSAFIVIFVGHDAGVVNNPAQLFYEVYDGATTEPFDEETATWNADEGEHNNAGYTLDNAGSIAIDNTETPDFVDFVGREFYGVTIPITSEANFRGDLESGQDWILLRLLGDTRLGQDNVEFQMISKEHPDAGTQVGGFEIYPTLHFTYESE